MIKFDLPSTRYLGSKAKLLPWLYQNLIGLDFNTALDAFGGTANVSYMFKALGKEVYFNDALSFNQDIGTAIIENSTTLVTREDINKVLKPRIKKDSKIIQTNFRGIYFKDNENRWLDQVTQNIHDLDNKYKRAIMLSALYQACLIKRPFNLFHRKNLSIRTKNVERSFGNKTTWERPFRNYFLRFLKEYNKAVFDNSKNNQVIGGYDAYSIPKKDYDLVYFDPPYLSKKSSVNYLDCYHFLEGLSKYNGWEDKIDIGSNNKKMISSETIQNSLDREKVQRLFKRLFIKFKSSTIVMSYRNDGVPSIKQIQDALKDATGKDPVIKQINYKYALSNGSTKEVLFIVR